MKPVFADPKTDVIFKGGLSLAERRGHELGLQEGEQRGRELGQKEGEQRGQAQATAQAILTVLAARGLQVDEATRAKILSTVDQTTLAGWLALAVTVASANELGRSAA